MNPWRSRSWRVVAGEASAGDCLHAGEGAGPFALCVQDRGVEGSPG